MKKHVFVVMLIMFILSILVVCGVSHWGTSVAFADSNVVYAMPINITNTQDVSTPSPFQVKIDVNSSEFAAYEAADLSNVAFGYMNASGYPNGTVIPSWLESGNSNSSTDTVYWLKIDGVPAASQATILMEFYPITTNILNNVTTGEAPQLSPSYGQYDDGSNVFIEYGDFNNSFDGWHAYQYTGNFVPQNSSAGVEMLDGNHYGATYLVPPSALSPSPTIVEEGWSYSGSSEGNVISMFGTSLSGSSTALMTSEDQAPVLNNSISAIFNYFSANFMSGRIYPYTHINDYIKDSTIGSSSFTGGGDFNVVSFFAVNGTWASAGYANQDVSLEEFGSTLIPTSVSGSASNPFKNSALIIGASDVEYYPQTTLSTQYIRWVIARALPPNGVAPTVAVGGVTSVFAVPEFPSITILPLLTVTTLLAIIVHRRKQVRCRNTVQQ